MVCVPCIVIPVLLWVFHKYIQPFILRFWNPWGKQSVVAKESGLPEGVDAENTQYKFIKENITKNPVMVFGKTTCSYCKMAKKVLDDIGVEYAVEEIDHREDCNDIQVIFSKMTGERTVPRVFVGQKCVGGGSEIWSLHNQGKLVPMLESAGAAIKKEGVKKTN